MKNCGKLINSWIELTCDHTYNFYEMDIYDAGFLKFVVCMLYFVNINIDISVSLFDYLFLILILVGLINSLEFQIGIRKWQKSKSWDQNKKKDFFFYFSQQKLAKRKKKEKHASLDF